MVRVQCAPRIASRGQPGSPLVAIIVLVMAACGDRRAVVDGPPASLDAGVDAVLDAAPDTMPAHTLDLEVDAGSGPITAWDAAASIDQTAAVTLVVSNAGAAAINVGDASITGPDAGDFAIVGGSTCAGRALPSGDRCVVRLAFTPSATGTRAAALRLTGNDGPLGNEGQFELPLRGEGTATRSGLIAGAASIDFGPIELHHDSDASVVLRNTGAADIALGARTISGSFLVATDSCPGTLAAGGSCTLAIRFTAARTGPEAGSLEIASSADSVRISLAGLGLRRITIVRQGTGEGTIASAPSGIDCGTTCSGLFFGAVTLTAVVADPAYSFAWGEPCGIDPSCTLPDGDSLTIDAHFDTIAPRITIVIDGSAGGFVVVPPLGTCTASCTIDVFPGMPVVLYAFTPSIFNGWAGACSGTAPSCDLGAVYGNLAVTVTFDRAEREVATLFPPATVTGLAMAPDGDVMFADATGVTKLSPAGAVAWTTPIAGGALDLASDATGDVFGRGGPGLFALSGTGAIAWTRAFATVDTAGLAFQSAVAASPDGTVIAVLTPGGVHVVDGSGVDRFVVDGVGAASVAVAPDGTVATAGPSRDYPSQVEVDRYTAAGTPLATLDPLPGAYEASIAYDAQGYLCDAVTGYGGVAVARTAPDLSNVFAYFEHVTGQGTLPAAIVSDAALDVIFLRGGYSYVGVSDLQLQVFSPTGTLLWNHAENASNGGADGLTVTALAGGGKRIAIAGRLDVATDTLFSLPWIKIYALP